MLIEHINICLTIGKELSQTKIEIKIQVENLET